MAGPTGPVIADVAFYNGVPVNGAVLNAYFASRFSGVPAMLATAPGAPDFGPVISGTLEGGGGEFEIPCVYGNYYVSMLYNNVLSWQEYSVPMTAGTNAQTLNANGAVTIDLSLGHTQQITLLANATSSSIINPTVGQIFEIEWIQGGAGSFTYAWPASTVVPKFAGGAAGAASTTTGYRDIYTFRVGTNFCYEISRSLAVH